MNSTFRKNQLLFSALVFLALSLGYSVNAQTPPPPPDSVVRTDGNPPMPPPPPPADSRPDEGLRPLPTDRPGGPGRANRGPVPNRAESLKPVTSFSGTVVRLLSNDDLVYDGFVLKTSTDSFQVHFPPYMGQTMRKSLKTGLTVAVNGVQNTAPAGEKGIELVNLTVGGSRIEMQVPPTPATLSAPSYSKGSGKITSLATDREGRVNALVIDNKKILRLPPSALQGLTQSPAIGNTVSYTGTTKETPAGEWLQSDQTVIHLRTITLNGQQYLVGPR